FDSQPARPGGVIILYANGLGPVDPPIATGATSGDGPLRFNTTTPQVLVGGQPAEVIFSGLAPQFTGVNQVNFIIPAAGIPLGDAVPVQIRVGDQITPVTVTIAIR
ncbi:MAG: hypothetical protein ACRD96_09970, partial [Bryobacteraceae bacterium]